MQKGAGTPQNLSHAAETLRWPILLGSTGLTTLAFLLPVHAKQLGADAIQIGGLFFIFGLVAAVLRPPSGWIMDRIGRKAFVVSGLAIYAFAMALFALSGASILLLYVARFVQGLAASGVWVAAYAIATDVTPEAGHGAAVGKIDGASLRGGFYGVVAGLLIVRLLGDASWTAMFAGYACLNALGAFLAWKYVPETLTAPAMEHEEEPRKPFGKLFKLMAFVIVSYIASSLASTLLIVFLQDRFPNMDSSVLTYAFIASALVQALLPTYSGRISDRLGRAPVVVTGLTLSAVCSLMIPWLPVLFILVVLWVLQAAGQIIAAPAQEAVVADLTGKRTRGVGYGLYTFAVHLGYAIGPLFGGVLYEKLGHGVPFYVNGCILLVCAVWGYLLLRKRKAIQVAVA